MAEQFVGKASEIKDGDRRIVFMGEHEIGVFKEKGEFADRFFREGKSGQWRKVLSPVQIDRVVTAHSQQMERFGYLPAPH